MCTNYSLADSQAANHQAANTLTSSGEAKESARALARLMEKQLGYCDGHIDSVALRLFIRAYWSRVAKYAHAIHDDRE